MTARTVAVNEAGLRIGEGHQNCKYTDGEIEMVLKLRDEGMGYGAIAKLVEMPKSTVQSICNARRRCQTAARWKSVPN
jgi:predicted acetyltransferase